jgi:DNA-binding MarR family transcriptional regulator
MRRVLATDDVARLARSAERLVRLAQAINERAMESASSTAAPVYPLPCAAPEAAAAPAEHLLQAARDALRTDRDRPHFGAPPLFQAKAWPLMLELFIAERCETDTSVKTACLSLGGSQTSALRCILDLERLGAVVSRADEKDGRRRLLNLSASARQEIEDYLKRGTTDSHRSIRLSLRMTKQSLPDTDENGSDSNDSTQIAPDSAQAGNGAEMVSQ